MKTGFSSDYLKGIAFVTEGATEKVFYYEYLEWCCRNMPEAHIEQLPNRDYVIHTPEGEVLVKFNIMGSVGSVPNAYNWVRSTCEKEDCPWVVALCYDTDGDASQNLNTRAWQRFRHDLDTLNLSVIDLAADADIEDIMLVDIDGVRDFLGLGPDVEPRGRKGKAKMNSLFKAIDVTQPYHEAERARDLVQHLSFDVIERDAPICIADIRNAIFN